MLRLKLLKAKACRGIVDGPPVEFGPGGLILCGDNGTGKSSFVDALEKVLADTCGSLDIGAQGVSWAKQGQNVACKKPPEVELVVTDGNRDTTLTLSTDAAAQGKNVKAFVEAARQQSFILRRRTLLKYVDAKPQERWEAIEEFLHLQGFNDFEARLKDLSQQTSSRVRDINNQAVAAERLLREQLELAADTTADEANCLLALNQLLGVLGEAQLSGVRDLDSRIDAVTQALTGFGRMESVELMMGLKAKAEAIPCAAGVLTTGKGYADVAVATEEEAAKLTGLFFDDVLRRGREWIDREALEACPLCGGMIARNAVVAEIDRRLSENRQLTELRSKLAFAHKEFLDALAKHQSALQDVKVAWSAAAGDTFPAGAAQALSALSEACKANAKLRPAATIRQGTKLLMSLDVVTSDIRAAVQGRLGRMPSLQDYTRLAQALSKLTAMKAGLDALCTLRGQLSSAANASAATARLAELAENARKKAVQELVDSVAELANRYLLRIHPEDGIDKAKLRVPDRGTASLALSNEFFEVEGDPRGHYSEGHLDSLGLCLFLAIRRLHCAQRPELAILVLDDVLHSVDGEHRRATADLIFDEFKDHQIIITTHDPLWFEHLKAAERAHSGGGKFKHYRIADWSIDTGPTWGDHKSDYEWLVSPDGVAGKPSDRAVKAGRLLEETLRHLCHGLNVRVPYSVTGDYTIDPLWTSFLPTARKNTALKTAIGKHLDDIDALRMQRNWVGAHWNAWALILTNKESREFADAVVALRRAVYCPVCQQFIQRVAQLDGVWSCKQECLRYDAK